VHMSRRIWLASTLALLLMIPVGASARTVNNESGTVSQLAVSWYGSDDVSAWYGDATASTINGETFMELFGQTITEISTDPSCWEESVVSGYWSPGAMSVGKKNGSAHATGTLDGYVMSYVYCEPDYEARDFFEEFRTIQVSIDFTATTAPEKVTRSDSTRVPGSSNTHSRVSGERRGGVAEVTFEGITRSAQGTLSSFRYSNHSDAMALTAAAVAASTSPVFNENGTVSQLVAYWSGTDGVNSWEGDATSYMLNGDTTLELWAHAIDQISEDPMCWRETWVSGFATGGMTVAKKNGSAYATATMDAHVSSYVFCEPTYEPRDEKEEFRTFEVSIDFTSTSAVEKVTLSESWKQPGTSNQHARISGERSYGVAEVMYDEITRNGEAILFSFKYSFHSNQKQKP
jgi:hypothetical protein